MDTTVKTRKKKEQPAPPAAPQITMEELCAAPLFDQLVFAADMFNIVGLADEAAACREAAEAIERVQRRILGRLQ